MKYFPTAITRAGSSIQGIYSPVSSSQKAFRIRSIALSLSSNVIVFFTLSKLFFIFSSPNYDFNN